MRLSNGFRAALVALIAMVGASFASTAWADSGSIRITFVKGGSSSARRPAAAR